MTTIINFYGPPCAGKSTEAAKLFVEYKEAGKNVELVTEYVKDWLWEGKAITKFDQLYITANQIYRETRLLGKVDYIITDSPVLLGVFYDEYYNPHRITRPMVRGYRDLLKTLNIEEINHWLGYDPKKKHQLLGRIQEEEECERISESMFHFLTEEAELVFNTAVKRC